MKNYVNEINEILYDYDIEGLADLGCPEDEYMNEAKMVFENKPFLRLWFLVFSTF